MRDVQQHGGGSHGSDEVPAPRLVRYSVLVSWASRPVLDGRAINFYYRELPHVDWGNIAASNEIDLSHAVEEGPVLVTARGVIPDDLLALVDPTAPVARPVAPPSRCGGSCPAALESPPASPRKYFGRPCTGCRSGRCAFEKNHPGEHHHCNECCDSTSSENEKYHAVRRVGTQSMPPDCSSRGSAGHGDPGPQAPPAPAQPDGALGRHGYPPGPPAVGPSAPVEMQSEWAYADVETGWVYGQYDARPKGLKLRQVSTRKAVWLGNWPALPPPPTRPTPGVSGGGNHSSSLVSGDGDASDFAPAERHGRPGHLSPRPWPPDRVARMCQDRWRRRAIVGLAPGLQHSPLAAATAHEREER